MLVKRVLLFTLSTLFLITATAQQKMNTYDAAWKKVDSLMNKKGLTISALTQVNKIYALAQKEKNDPQLIKALLFKMGLQSVKEENALQKNILLLEKEIQTATEPARSILQSMTAGQYHIYFTQHRWQLYDRTATQNFVKEDLATWGADDFHTKISTLYLASLKNEKLLQQTRLEAYDPIIFKGNVRYLRPTLFDLLAHRALDYFQSDERNIRKAADVFEINDPTAFGEAATFAAHPFPVDDSSSLHVKALQLFQRLIRSHLSDAKPDALIDVDIKRLVFAESYAVMDNKQVLYRKALEQLIARFGHLPIAAQASYLLAASYAEDARTYDPLKDTTHRYAWIKAKVLCEKIVQQKDSSEGKANCINLLTEIQRKEIALQAEAVNVPEQPFRILVTYRNVTQLYVRVVKMDKKTKAQLSSNRWEDNYWIQSTKLPVLKTFTQSLPDTRDHQQHRTEIKAEGLPVGEYAFIISANKEFSLEKNPLAIQSFHVSNLAYINNGQDYYVLNRETGAPVYRAAIQVWYRNYDYNTQKNVDRQGENMVTDKNGHFVLYPSKTRTDREYRLEVTTKDDHLLLDNYVYNYQRAETTPVKALNQTFLFADRSIYRPGQTLYFKGIVINRRNDQNAVVTNFPTTVILYDVNRQVIDSVKVTTNAYGSYSGKFTLPSNVLNGQFSIQDKKTSHSIYFSVEEYKRPKFYTEIAKPAGTYKLNDSIRVTGTAKAYAGNNIDGAAVKYRVVRKTIIPLWYYGWGKMIWPPQRGKEVEIAHGTTTTKADGSFTVTFKALPDLSIDKKGQPTFHYEVSADVTDINGETRSGNTSVAVAYQALQLKVNTPGKLYTDSLKQIKVSTTNLNDLFEQASVTLTIHKLKTPERIYRNRYWEQPDQFVMTQPEYYAAFPYDVYKNEDEVSTWEKLEKVLEVTDTTTASGQFSLRKTSLPAGWYVIEAVTKDKYGESVKDIQYIQLYNKAGSYNPLAFGSIKPAKSVYEPGETASYQLTSNLDSVFMIHDIGRKNTKDERKFTIVNRNNPSFEIPITENDRGGLGVQIAFVKHNRAYSDNLTLQVPYTNKELTISYTTFRDKTLPGSAEKWKVKISGYKGDQVAAEVLTSMYDASLDQFQPHSWSKPDLWNNFFFNSMWTMHHGFQAIGSEEKPRNDEESAHFPKDYDQLYIASRPIHNEDGSFRDLSFVTSDNNWDVQRYLRVPDLKSDPDGSKGIMRDQVVVAEGAADMLVAAAPAARQGEMFVQGGKVKKNMTAGLIDSKSEEEQETSAPPAVQPRKNFNETAFLFPDLHTDAEGNVEFSFTMPEALTQWKWMTLAHTKELAFGYSEKSIITQKELMVQPNAPRFMREGDRMDFSGKIVNLSSKELTGQVELQLIDPTTNQSVDGWFRNVFPNQFFTVAAGQSIPVSFSLEIPYQYNKPVTYRIVAATKAGANEQVLSDGEENMLPVVSNRMLVTESLPLPIRGSGTKTFTFDKLLKSGESETLNQHAVTVEFTSNPAWYAVQALPYLMEYPYECAEQVFNRYYANTLATSIANASPRIKAIFERWKTADTAALLSNLQKNEELKSVLLQETPWVLQAKSEAQQKKNIALLFDMVRMAKEQQSALGQLQDMQSPNGGFVWFEGGPDDRYITQYIVTGIAHLKKLKAAKEDTKITTLLNAAIPYLDKALKKDYDDLLKNNKQKEPVYALSSIQIQYLYMRSFFPATPIPANVTKAYNYFRKQAQQHWLKQSRYMQGLIALALHRTGDDKTATAIVASLKENALTSEEMGMYWKDMTGGYYWYQSPIESQALLIETFTEVTKDAKAVAGMKTWLLKQKQTQHWKTTKATADACYALLLQGTDWLTATPEVQISLGNYTINSASEVHEAGTGYLKKVIDGKDVKPEMGNIKVSVSSTAPAAGESVAWGAVYWQYFENLDKIIPPGGGTSTPLKLSKKLFVEKNTDRGPVLTPVNEGDALNVGDKIKVRIELRVDRNMEYVHMKDMRAACMEPVNVLSNYKWQGGLGYYESTKDASTNFFFGYLPKGTWVFEYPLFVTHTGTFSNGVTSIQCMYAPEFTSHSEGIKVNVEAK